LRDFPCVPGGTIAKLNRMRIRLQKNNRVASGFEIAPSPEHPERSDAGMEIAHFEQGV
jgi:hypothetical protein